MSRAQTAILVALFTLLFTTVGWLAPVMYASHAPADHFIEEDAFTAPDTSTDATVHRACFNRTVHRATSGTVITELYLVSLDGTQKVEVLSEEGNKYFQKGQYSIEVEIDLPASIPPGQYRYERVYTMELASGRVVRTFAFESEKFNITEGGQDTPTHTHSC